MIGVNALLAIAGVSVTVLVIAAIILITPRGAISVRHEPSNLSARHTEGPVHGIPGDD